MLTIILLISLFRILAGHPLKELIAETPPGDPIAFGVVASLIASSFMVGAVIGPDVTRYAKNRKHAVEHPF